MGIKNVKVDDGGQRKAMMDGMKLVTTIAGDGLLTPPMQDDPDEIYITIFQQALRDQYWITHAPQNLPLLQQRLMMQQQQFQIKQQQQLMQQMAMQQLMNPPQQPGQKGNGNQPPKQGKPAEDHGQLNQHIQG